MFVIQSRACDLPNSATPMPASWISAQNARVSKVARSFINGDGALFGLVDRLGGNSPGADRGNAGIPTTGFFSPTWLPSPPAGSLGAGGGVIGSGSGSGSRMGGGSSVDGSIVCTPPQVVPVSVSIPVPVIVTPISTTRSTPTPATPPPASLVAPCVSPSDCAPTAENICRNARNGCYAPGQVSDLQLQLCAMAGWSGRGSQIGCPSGWNNGAKIPVLNRAPVTPSGQSLTGINPLFDQLGAATGLTGLALPDSGAARVALAVAAVGAVWWLSKKGRRY